jgi:hypothetical protein
MESQMKNQNGSSKGYVAMTALYRLVLLVGPEVATIKLLGYAPFVCFFACVIILGLWLSVDIGPFRAVSTVSAKTSRPLVKQPVAVSNFPQNLGKAQWWSYLFCKVLVFGMLFHSKLMI